MSKVLSRLWVLVILLPVLIPTPSKAADYLETLREAVSCLELGAYDQAASGLDRALSLDSADPLGHMAFGVLYMHTSRLDEAKREFEEVLKSQPDNWRAQYALGVISIARGREPEAESMFSLAGKHPEGQAEVAALKSYLAYLKGGDPPSSTLPLARQTAATRAMEQGNREEAVALLSAVLRVPAPLGFEENRAPLATFDKTRPVALPGGRLSWTPIKAENAPVVSGTVTLKADAGHTSPAFVLFYIDGNLVGITNYSPFQLDWNTRNYTNGLHEVKIEGKTEGGVVVSTKTIWVRVSNPDPSPRLPREGPAVDELTRRLWGCTRMSEVRKLAHYHLAKLHLAAGDRERALEQLEYTVAYQPDFRDARALLLELRGGKSGYSEITQGRQGRKLIALTFDDGPNERTEQLLEVLAKLNVPATFFLVGFRAEGQPDLVRKIQTGGHQIENHTYTHPNLIRISEDAAESELSKCAGVIRAITGKPSFYFRPPGGHADEATRRAAGRQGLKGVFWTINCSPFEGERHEGLADHVIRNATDGGIVLMHNGEPATVSALPRIVSELRAQGYRFVTISEIDTK